jgi:hypothetical protein
MHTAIDILPHEWPPSWAMAEAVDLAKTMIGAARKETQNPELAAAFAKLESELAKGHPNPEPQDDE